MRKYNLHALVAAGLVASGLTATNSQAADLGGNCCADLEERIAELEATTARKGNRKVSLTLSGWVGQQISFWDDGTESNVYIHDLGTTLGSHVKFTGAAQIMPGISAGYVLHIEAINSDSLTTSQDTANGPAALVGTPNGVQTLQSYFFLKSETLGKISMGKQSQASDNAAILVDGSGSLIPANWVAFDVNSFGIRRKDGLYSNGSPGIGNSLTWGNAQSCRGMGGAWGDCNGLPENVVRYDSPTFAGFSVSASWGADDMWDVAGRFAGEGYGFKLATTIAYNEVRDSLYNGGTSIPNMNYLQVGAFLMHVPTGLFGLVNYGNLTLDGLGERPQTWYGKIGLRTRFSALGHTVFYGEYENGRHGAYGQVSGVGPGIDSLADSQLQVWGGGIVQEIDAAAMSMWVKYRNLSFDDGLPEATHQTYSDFNYVGVGGLINF